MILEDDAWWVAEGTPGKSNRKLVIENRVVRQFDFFNRERSGEPKVELTHYRKHSSSR